MSKFLIVFIIVLVFKVILFIYCFLLHAGKNTKSTKEQSTKIFVAIFISTECANTANIANSNIYKMFMLKADFFIMVNF